ncbi:hypothetical protein BGW39_002314, partial [Mortierella sp. 14UC]
SPVMDSAAERFFESAELLGMTGSLLEKKRDLSYFMRSRRLAQTICAPLLYKDIDMVSRYPGLRWSPESLHALIRNSHAVQSIAMGGQLLELYYLGVVKATGDLHGQKRKQQQEALRHQTHSIPPASQSLPTAMSTCDGVLLRLCRVLPSSPLLTAVHLGELHIKTENQLRLLARTITAMEYLEDMSLDILCSTRPLQKTIVPTLFFSCPPTLKSAVFDLKAHGPAHSDIVNEQETNTPPNSTLVTMLQDPPSRRQAPLQLLTKLYLNCAAPDSTDTNSVRSMLAHCPALVSLGMPACMGLKESIQEFSEAVVKTCPRLQDLHQEYAAGGHEESVMAALINAMPKETLRAFSFNGFNEGQNNFESAFQRHSGSLTKISLPACQDLSEHAIAFVIHCCGQLVEFEAVAGVKSEHEPSVDVEFLWRSSCCFATRKLQILRLTVGIRDWLDKKFEVNEEEMAAVDDEDFHENFQPRPYRVEKELMNLKQRIGRIYEEIGEQTDLRILELRVAMSSSHLNDSYNPHQLKPKYTYRDEIFPDILSLGKKRKTKNGSREWGGLPYFSKLSKLEELRGSVCVSLIDGAFEHRIGKDEAEWMLKHWPKLRVAEFYQQEVDNESPYISQHFKWLVEQMPGLQIVDK